MLAPAFLFLNAGAQKNPDLISWPTWIINIKIPVAHAGISLYGEYRFVSNISAVQSHLHSLSAYYEIPKWQITIGAGLVRGYIQENGTLYNRIGFVFKHIGKKKDGGFDLRLLFENPKTVPKLPKQTAISRNTRWGLLIGHFFEIKGGSGLYAYNDFYVYQSFVWFSENRFFLGPRFNILKKGFIELGFLHHWVKGRTDNLIEYGITAHFNYSFTL
jgi:hypothetical protein